MRTCHNADANIELRRKVAVFKRHGWIEMFAPNGLFTRALMSSADGKWVAKFAEVVGEDCDDAWSTYYAPFCHDVYTGKRPIDTRARPLIPVMPLFKRGRHIAVAVIERLYVMPGEDDARTDAERKAYKMYSASREACWSGDAWVSLSGGAGAALRAMREAIGRKPDDLHDKNVMLRRGAHGGRPTLVFTDPYAYVYA